MGVRVKPPQSMACLLPGGGGTGLKSQHSGGRGVDLCEFKACLVYKAHSRTARNVTQRNPLLKNLNK